ncbi:MAG: AlpA family phage regulatory protein [SAR324 cluster bacterium]|nr:AlpA family phage regulatory protein [SAR324 cluster bacterium]
MNIKNTNPDSLPNNKSSSYDIESALDHIRLLRIKDLTCLLGMSTSTIYKKFTRYDNMPQTYDPDFPKPIRLGNRSIAWRAIDINKWLELQLTK